MFPWIICNLLMLWKFLVIACRTLLSPYPLASFIPNFLRLRPVHNWDLLYNRRHYQNCENCFSLLTIIVIFYCGKFSASSLASQLVSVISSDSDWVQAEQFISNHTRIISLPKVTKCKHMSSLDLILIFVPRSRSSECCYWARLESVLAIWCRAWCEMLWWDE